MILVIDNYDSFTWNIVHHLEVLGVRVEVCRNDGLSVDQAMTSGAAGIVLSPGPGRPSDAGVSLDIVAACAADRRPLLGVCLGHQAIAQHFGAAVERAPRAMHGKICNIHHRDDGILTGLLSPFAAVRYNSLTVRPDRLPDWLLVTARADDGTIQGLSHRDLPIHGVQFHPESIASEHGSALFANFLRLAEMRWQCEQDAPTLVA